MTSTDARLKIALAYGTTGRVGWVETSKDA
jgi:hypothetical protein